MELKSKLIGPIFFFSILLLISHQGYAGVKKNGYDGLLKSCYSNYESREVIKFKKCSKQLLKQYPDYAGGYIANAILSNWANRANSAYDYLLTASNKKLNKDTECDLNLWLARILGTKNEYDKSLRYYNLAQKKCEFVISKEQSEDLVDEMDKIKKLNIQRNQKNTAQQSPAVIENIKKLKL
jgi:hypothetical protein